MGIIFFFIKFGSYFSQSKIEVFRIANQQIIYQIQEHADSSLVRDGSTFCSPLPLILYKGSIAALILSRVDLTVMKKRLFWLREVSH
jgi:hypothetical protein